MLIDEHRGKLPIEGMCRLTGASKTAYYHWLKKPIGESSDGALIEEMKSIKQETTGYGYRRMRAELKRRDLDVNHKKVLKIMRAKGLDPKEKTPLFAHYRFQAWLSHLSQSDRKLPTIRNRSALGIRYHLHPASK